MRRGKQELPGKATFELPIKCIFRTILSHFSSIVPRGVSDQRYGVTSIAELGLTVSMLEIDMVLRAEGDALTLRRSESILPHWASENEKY